MVIDLRMLDGGEEEEKRVRELRKLILRQNNGKTLREFNTFWFELLVFNVQIHSVHTKTMWSFDNISQHN